MPRSSHRQHQGGHSAEFWDDDDLYEDHTVARERNHDVYEDKDVDKGNREEYEDKDVDYNKQTLYRGSRARRTEKSKPAKASASLERDYVMVDYQKHYSFIQTTVNNLISLYLKVLYTHTSLKALALRTMLNTQIENINNIMDGLPDLGLMLKTTVWGHERMVVMERDIHQNYKRFIKKMSQIAALEQQLHPHLDLWYTQEGLDFPDGNI